MSRFVDFSGDGFGLGPPTKALPGSVEKIRTLVCRARLRQRLWHPDDAKMPSVDRLPDKPLFTDTEIRAARRYGKDGSEDMYKRYLKRLAGACDANP